MRALRVRTPDGGYDVSVGAGLLERAHELIARPAKAERIALFADAAFATGDGVAARDRLRSGLAPLGLEVLERGVDGEGAKSVASAERAWRDLASSGFHRNDLVVAFGGGVTGDLAGFVAGTFHRGMPWLAVPTTLLAMVDASIGGKTAVNLPEGKNLVGAFHHPLAVIADTSLLAGLPDAAFRTGLAEVVKHGLIDAGGLRARLHEERAQILAREPRTLDSLVADAADVKVRIVGEDPTERGARAWLNYGHTLGHALEALGGYARWTHGEAVSIGMVFAATLAAKLGYPDLVQEHRALLEAYGLPTRGAGAPYDEVAAMWARDKKYEGGMRFVLLEDLGRPAIVGGIGDDVLRAAYEAVR